MANKRCLTLFITAEMDIEATVNFFTYLPIGVLSWMNAHTQL